MNVIPGRPQDEPGTQEAGVGHRALEAFTSATVALGSGFFFPLQSRNDAPRRLSSRMSIEPSWTDGLRPPTRLIPQANPCLFSGLKAGIGIYPPTMSNGVMIQAGL